MDHMSDLYVDIFFHLIAYLHFDDIITICTLNRKLHSYGIDSTYDVRWKVLTNKIYGDVDDYASLLNKLWTKLYLPQNTYNYLVYIKLIMSLDHVNQLIIYKRMGDNRSFNDKKYKNEERYYSIALEIARKYYSWK